MSKVDKYKQVTKSNFKDLDEHSVLIAYSEFCPSCETELRFMPLFHDNATLYILDFDVEDELCNELDVCEVPHLIYIYNGKVVGNLWGLQEQETIISWMNHHGSKDHI